MKNGKTILLVLTALCLAFCQRTRTPEEGPAARPRNAILITIDTLRADRVSCYSDRHVQTPNLDGLASDGVVFESCLSQTPLTLPAHATILSGTYPLHHQVRDNGGFVVSPKLPLLGEVLSRSGFATAAFVGAYVLHSKWGLNRGFSLYADAFKEDTGDKVISLDEIQKRAGEVLGEASAWLAKNKSQKTFSWIHLYDPHASYDPPTPFKEKFAERPYEGEVAYTDDELGKFFAFLKKEGYWDNSLIIVTADHGESLWEHDEETHGFFVYEAAVRVPLIMKAPSAFPRKRLKNLVEHVDLAPTILEMLDLPVPASVQGRSLLGLIRGREKDWPETAYTETYYPRLHFGWSELSAWYSQGWKFILAPGEELYDLADDPAEKDNRTSSEAGRAKDMRSRLVEFVREKSKGALTPEINRQMDIEAAKKLASLGYVTSFSEAGRGKDLADPKEKIRVHNDLNEAKQLFLEKKLDEAIAIVKKILDQDPEIIDAYMFLGNLYYSQNRFPEALGCFRDVLKRKPDYNFAMINVLNCLINSGELDEAVSEGRKCLQIFPGDAIFLYTMGDIHFLKKEYDRALEFLFSALAIEAGHAETLSKIGEIYLAKRDAPKAEEYLRRALDANPGMAKAYFGLALLEESRSNPTAATGYYHKALELEPQNYKAAYNLAELLSKAGRREEALRYYEKAREANPSFNIPYFMIAKYYLDIKANLEEAIKLCERGTAIVPPNKYTALGFYILADIYSYLGDKEKSDYYSAKGKSVSR